VDRRDAFVANGCDIVAIRSDSRNAVKSETEGRYTALRFVVDVVDKLSTALRMNVGGLLGGDRHTYLIDSSGRVQGQMNNYADPFCHSVMCLRTMKALDDPLNPWDAASEAVDREAATRQAMFEQAQLEEANRQAETAERLAAEQSPDAVTDTASTPPSVGNFFEGFFGAFQKK